MRVVYISIPFIGLYGVLYAYYVYSSRLYVRLSSEKQIFYINTIITLIPPTIYTYNILNQLAAATAAAPPPPLIPNFLIEWSIATPLLLLNITTLCKVRLFKHLILCLFSIGMNVFGYAAYEFRSSLALFSGLVAGGVACFAYILSQLLLIYYKRNWVFYSDTVAYARYIRFMNMMIYVVMSTWTLYPIVFILHGLGSLDELSAIVAFMILDFFSKGVFIANILRHQDMLYAIDTFTNQTRWPVRGARVAPEGDEGELSIEIL